MLAITMMRSWVVSVCRDDGETLEQAYMSASDLLKGTPAAGEPRTMRRAHIDMRRLSREQRLGAQRGERWFYPARTKRK